MEIIKHASDSIKDGGLGVSKKTPRKLLSRIKAREEIYQEAFDEGAR
jgi:hypothetical protein